ncbi:MAG: hypothetical protein RR237_02535, partial [Acetivibrio sp.]
TSAGGFDKWGGVYELDESSKGKISYSFDGKIKDQYGTYNAYLHEDQPNIVLPLQSIKPVHVNPYAYLVDFSNTDLVIDKEEIYKKMVERGEKEISITVKLVVPSVSCANAEDKMFTKEITFKRG